MLNQLHVIVYQQSGLVHNIAWGDDPIKMETQRCDLDSCDNVKKYQDCGRDTCLHNVYELKDQICVICGVKQIKECRRIKTIDRR